MNLRHVLRISIFDFRHLLRDTHTLIYSIAIPLFLYPMLFLGLTQILMVAQGASEQRVVKVAVAGAEHFPELVAHLGDQPKLEVIPRPGNPRVCAELGGGDRNVQVVYSLSVCVWASCQMPAAG